MGTRQCLCLLFFFFFFNDTATTEIYTLSLHDALPICDRGCRPCHRGRGPGPARRDRKSTRLNSSHGSISYAVFCLKKKKKDEVRSSSDSRHYVLSSHDCRHPAI